jgi:hypothetical protein
VFDTARQLQFTHSLERFSQQFDELLTSARQFQSQLPAELADEIALITGELMLVLTNHPAHLEEESVREALSHAQNLRAHLRIDRRERSQLTQECDSFNQEIARLVRDSKKAA